MKNPPGFWSRRVKSLNFSFVKNPYFYVFLRLTTQICCQIVVSCQLRSPETLEFTAFYLPMLFNVGNRSEINSLSSESAYFRGSRFIGSLFCVAITICFHGLIPMDLLSICCNPPHLLQRIFFSFFLLLLYQSLMFQSMLLSNLSFLK